MQKKQRSALLKWMMSFVVSWNRKRTKTNEKCESSTNTMALENIEPPPYSLYPHCGYVSIFLYRIQQKPLCTLPWLGRKLRTMQVCPPQNTHTHTHNWQYLQRFFAAAAGGQLELNVRIMQNYHPLQQWTKQIARNVILYNIFILYIYVYIHP